MKKFLLLLALAASVACNTEDEKDSRQSADFGGTLTVTSNRNPEAEPFVASDVTFELTEDNNGLFKLTMHEIRFAASMPMKLTIVIPELKYEDANGDGIYELTSTADPIVPYIGGKPYSDFKIPVFTGRVANAVWKSFSRASIRKFPSAAKHSTTKPCSAERFFCNFAPKNVKT